ncbi:hypothetical protein ACA910_010778 [Epithemia clementina (nom. ined.)]
MVFGCGCDADTSDDNEFFDPSPPKYRVPKGSMDLVVTVPKNFREGNLIIVKSPFGTRSVQIIIPPGVKEGGKFIVSLPPPTARVAPAQSPNFSAAVENMITPTPVVVGKVADMWGDES